MKVFITSLFFFFNFLANAQQDHFIYLQTENKQPFFVKLKDKTFTSSPLGYVIIGNLRDGIYSLVVSFPQSTSQQEFNCVINNKDVGFFIKSNAENQWQLQNVESLAVIVPGEVRTKVVTDTLQKETDPFSTMLANAVNDSTILQKDVVKEIIPEKVSETVQKDTSQVIVAKNDVAIATPSAEKKKIKIKKTSHAPQNSTASKKPVPSETIAAANDKEKTGSTDTTQAIAAHNSDSKPADSLAHSDVAITPPVTNNTVSLQTATAAIDSIINKDSAITAERSVESLKKDSLQTAINNSSPLNDSLQKVTADNDNKPAAKKKVKSKTKIIAPPEPIIKESETAVVKNTTKTDSLNNIIADNTPATKVKIKRKKNAEASDAAIVLPDVAEANNDVSVLPLKKVKRKRKGEIQDTLTVKSNADVAIKETTKTETPPFIDFDRNVTVPLSIIKRKFKKNTKQGLEMLYVDADGDTKDTIRVLIPADNKVTEEVKQDKAAETSQVKEPDIVKAETVTKEKKTATVKEPVAKVTMINSDCKSVATDDDFLKIRKKMIAENNDEDMIRAAKKVFKTKCFTTEQVKNLSVLFLKDEGKYMFFDAAYPYVSDTELFATLQSQLSDEYYITRFRAMIHK